MSVWKHWEIYAFIGVWNAIGTACAIAGGKPLHAAAGGFFVGAMFICAMHAWIDARRAA